MKVTDYIIEYLVANEISDIFGYPGGVICHLIDSATKYSDKISIHTNYHEQASAFSACGYAQECGKLGVAFSTSGPGATNLVTGIANAYFDSVPVLFLSGQVDTYGLKGNLPIRQRGFQETDIVSMVKPVTKYAVRVDNPEDIVYELEKAVTVAFQGNPGPVLLDLPADVQRAEIEISQCKHYILEKQETIDYHEMVKKLNEKLSYSVRPCLLIGNGVKQSFSVDLLKEIIHKAHIPAVFSMPAFDTLPFDDVFNFGFIGANGHRFSNFVLGKSDLIITIGSRLDLKQVGNNRSEFAKQAQIIRIDIDEGNLCYKVHNDEIQIKSDIKNLLMYWSKSEIPTVSQEWNSICKELKCRLMGYDNTDYTNLLRDFCKLLPDNTTITADVGQSEVWVAQQLQVKKRQSVHMSAGLGSMGYSLPAAIGSYYATNKPVISFNGDGGIQMNIQELQFISRERLPITVVVINNKSLGMIRGFQEANFDKNYSQTTNETGYSAPDFSKIANAYGLNYEKIECKKDIDTIDLNSGVPKLIELVIQGDTLLEPNFGRNGLIQDQRPYLDRMLFDELMKL